MIIMEITREINIIIILGINFKWVINILYISMSTQAGKGDKIRKGADLNAYWSNYDNIFRKKDDMSDEDREEMMNDRDTMSYSEWIKFKKD